MKILKYGEGYPKTAVCGHCKSELEYDFNDICSYDDLLEYIVTTGIITCPVCGKNIEVYRYTRQRPDLKLEKIAPKKRWWQR